MKNRSLIIILSIILSASALCPAMQVQTVHAASVDDFTDVAANYWGRQFIAFAADAGIINGYPASNGTFQFKPEDPVTKEESIQMIYQAVKNSGIKSAPEKDIISEYEAVLTENSIDKWAWECVSFAMENDVIEETELIDFRTDNNVPVKATREQVARWTAKAVERDLMPATSLDYPDKDLIAGENLVYADLLNRMSIMVGDNNGKFNPDSGIKRVEFAVICTRVYELADSSFDMNREYASYQGTVTSVNAQAGKIFMSMADGSARVIDVEKNAEIVFNGKKVYNNLNNIKSGQKAIIAYSTFGQVHISTEVLLCEGEIRQITPMGDAVSKLEIRISGGNTVYYFTDGVTSVLDEPKEGKDVVFIADGVKILEIANR